MKTEKHWNDIIPHLINEINIVIEVLDARHPIGTRNISFEKYIKDHNSSIEIIYVINKMDLIPREVLSEWIDYFRGLELKGKIIPITAKYSGGVHKLLKYLRSKSHHKLLNAMVIGYPNTGKSTLIGALCENKKKIGISGKAGFTRALMKVKISDTLFLVDTPGVIPFDETNETELVLKSCMLADKMIDPLAAVEAIYDIITPEDLIKQYDLDVDADEITDDLDNLVQKVGIRNGMLRKGGVVNENAVHLKIIRDWQNNHLKYYVLPPSMQDPDQEKSVPKLEKKDDGSFKMPTSLRMRKKRDL